MERKINAPCERCGTETLECSDASGSWEDCPNPACRHYQNTNPTPPGEGFLSMDPQEVDRERHGSA